MPGFVKFTFGVIFIFFRLEKIKLPTSSSISLVDNSLFIFLHRTAKVVSFPNQGFKLNSLEGDDLKGLVRLENLNLSRNRLKSLPATVASLRNLKELDLSSNLFKSWPQAINKLNKLEQMFWRLKNNINLL